MNKTTNTLIATGIVALLIILCAIAWYKTGNKPQESSGEAVEENAVVAGDEKAHMVDAYIEMAISLRKLRFLRKVLNLICVYMAISRISP